MDFINNSVLRRRKTPLELDVSVGCTVKVKSREGRTYSLLIIHYENGFFEENEDDFDFKAVYGCYIDFVDEHGDFGGAEPGDYIEIRLDNIYSVSYEWAFQEIMDSSGEYVEATHKSGVILKIKSIARGDIEITPLNIEEDVKSGRLPLDTKKRKTRFNALADKALAYYGEIQAMKGEFIPLGQHPVQLTLISAGC